MIGGIFANVAVTELDRAQQWYPQIGSGARIPQLTDPDGDRVVLIGS